MKEFYISPELNLLCLTPEEKLMSSDSDIEFDDMLQGSGGGVSANPDIDIDIPLN